MTEQDTLERSVERLPLKSLGLKSGMAVQTRRLAKGASKTESQFYGAIEGKGVMVGPLGAEGNNTGLEIDDICVVRGFTGQYEFSFLSKVLQTFEKPFVYALLMYPAQVDARLVRQSLRTKVAWPCSVESTTPGGKSTQTALVDLSASGAMIKSAETLGVAGGQITLLISAELENAPLQLRLASKICHSNRATDGDAYFIGVAFTGLNAQDRELLRRLTSGAAG